MSNFVLKKNQLNSIAMTLSERSQLINPYFLFVFKSKFQESKIEFLSVQSSGSNIRYDLIEFNEGVDFNLFTGEWYYEVFESKNSTLNVDDTTMRVLQKGLLIVIE
jgi:hypothetical protein